MERLDWLMLSAHWLYFHSACHAKSANPLSGEGCKAQISLKRECITTFPFFLTPFYATLTAIWSYPFISSLSDT